jgi:ribonucleoside-diphosphate reductase alpha chain
VRRRDGRLVPFDRSRIERAVVRAAREVGHVDPDLATQVAGGVIDDLTQRLGGRIPNIEQMVGPDTRSRT